MIKRTFLMFILLICCCGCENDLSCDEGFELIEDKCVKEETIKATYETTYYCNSSSYNEVLDGYNCVYYIEMPASISNNCPTYYREYGSRCKFMFGSHSRNCASNEVEWGNRCYKEYLNNNSSYYCPIGDLKGTTCVQKYSYKAYEKYEYTCPTGYELNSAYGLCTRKIYRSPNE